MRKIKVLILADAASSHTIKWVNALYSNGYDIAVFSFRNPEKLSYPKEVQVYCGLDFSRPKKNEIFKLDYLKAVPYLKKLYKKFQPDYVHSYYATSYGLMGMLLKHQPFYISVWGSDVYEFPNKSWFHKFVLKRILNRSDQIFSTSEDMKIETRKYASNPITVIPFGVDIDLFKALEKKTPEQFFAFGTVKTLEHIYGIDLLIRSFALFTEKNPMMNVTLKIAGEGSLKKSLQDLTHELGISEKVTFFGYIPQKDVPHFLNGLDVFMVLSRRESFGVAAVEAAACQLPVIASNTGGLKETVLNNKTGYLVNCLDLNEVVTSMEKLFHSPDLCEKLGQAGRKFVLEKYNWHKNADQMKLFYQL